MKISAKCYYNKDRTQTITNIYSNYLVNTIAIICQGKKSSSIFNTQGKIKFNTNTVTNSSSIHKKKSSKFYYNKDGTKICSNCKKKKSVQTIKWR